MESEPSGERLSSPWSVVASRCPAEDCSLFLQVLHKTSLEGNVTIILQRNEN